MPSSPGAIPRPGRPAAFAPEPTRAGAPADTAGRPQLGPGLDDAPTEVAGPASEPPPVLSGLPSSREEAESLPPPPPNGAPVEAFAEFEGDAIAGESTRIEDRDVLAEESTGILEDAPKLPFLFVESGKDQGREYVLQEGETSIGRGIDNDVILADVSVSRRHFRIQREGGAITLRDLGSGNGTQVNGRRAHVEVLSDGDRIELGETVLVLRVPGSEVRPDAQSATHETVAPISGGVPVVPAAAGYLTPGPTLPPVGASTDELVSPRDGRTQSIVLPRRMLFLAAAAVAIVGSVIGAGVVSLMAREPETVATSVPPRTAVVSVPGAPTSLPAVGALPVTPTLVPGVPPTPGAPTPAAPPTPGAPIPAVAAVPVPTPAVPAPATGSPVIVPTPTPTPAPVVAGGGPAATPTPTPTPAVVEDEPETGGRSGGRRRTGGAASTGASGGSTGSSGGGGRSAAVAAYRSGDFTGAARLAREAARGASARDRSALERLAGDIDDFARLHRTIQAAGTSYSRVGASDAARAIRLDRSIGGGVHTRTFAAGYVDWLLDQAESSFSGDPAGACRQARAAGDIEGSARSRAMGDRCAERARGMLAEASRAERTDPARARDLYRAILRIVPGTSEATEAQRRVDALGRTRIVDEDE